LTAIVIDASVVIKWVVPEADTEQALELWNVRQLCAPDLIYAECANVLWKKYQRNEHTIEENQVAAKIITHADIESVASRTLIESAVSIAMQLNHPAYDCLYIALALERAGALVTADTRLLNKLAQSNDKRLSGLAISLTDAPAKLNLELED
jgi:predicted nucleic acid-binding protein